ASLGASISINEAAPSTVDDNGVKQWLIEQIAKNSAFQTPDDNTDYVIYYPVGTTISFEQLGQTFKSCTGMAGYHSSVTLSAGPTVKFSVIPRCPSEPAPGLSSFEQATATSSHEIMEGTADPILTKPTYQLFDPDHAVWSLIMSPGG